MDKKLLELMKLQGQLRVAFVKLGIDEVKSLELSSEALHLFLTSPIAKEEYAERYRQLNVATPGPAEG